MQKRDEHCRSEVHTWSRGWHRWRVQTQRGAGMAHSFAPGRKAEYRGVGVGQEVHLVMEA